MPRYAALLRGIMPTNAKMPQLRAAFASAGFTDVETVLGSGNVVFTARAATGDALQRKAESAMNRELGKSFLTIVRSIDTLRELIASDPFAGFDVAPGAKRVVTFLRDAPSTDVEIPPAVEGARIHAVVGREIFTSCLRGAKTPVFMALIERTFGKELTTRTWDTVQKIAR
ncbi:MAG TPA: DUF1697 domain-containing protein [Gemmatimonadaceae bacterium]|nr:DUF1697 domain-containing protein [Gemmatimonadaceae bacterium]